MAQRLIDKVETIEKKEDLSTHKSAAKSILNNDGSKDKQISAKVNERVYDLFSQINKAQGVSNNSALNLLISRYVRENKGILIDDNLI